MSMDDYYLLGALDEMDELGALRRLTAMARPTSRVSASRSTRAAAARQVADRLVPPVPGAPTPGLRQLALGFPTHTFQNAAATVVTLQANPQRTFRPERLIVAQRRSAGAVAELVSLTNFDIGAVNQRISADGIPIDGFTPDSVGTVLALDSAQPGIIISLQFTISAAPGVGETVTIQPMLIGPTWT